MKIAIVYHSAGGNTKALADVIHNYLPEAEMHRMVDFDLNKINEYDGLLIGAYTWADGELPAKAKQFYSSLEEVNLSHLTTGVFGTGETNYRSYCGAVDEFCNLLKEKSNLVVSVKVEQMYQPSDTERVKNYCRLFKERLQTQKSVD